MIVSSIEIIAPLGNAKLFLSDDGDFLAAEIHATETRWFVWSRRDLIDDAHRLYWALVRVYQLLEGVEQPTVGDLAELRFIFDKMICPD